MSTDTSFTPKSLTASEDVLALFGPFDNVAVLSRNRRLGHTLQRITKADIIASPAFQSVLAEQNRAGADIFIGMNPIKDGAFSRAKESLKEIRHVYLDLDRNGDEALTAIRNALDVPPPNFVLSTSPRKHQVVWRIEGLTLEQAESLLHSMASQLGGDLAATDATRVLRLPGFANRKLAQEFIVQVAQETDRVYSLRDFNIAEESPEEPRHVADIHANHRPSGHRSQSVIQRIADFRADDKSDPNDYARRTVTKAQAELTLNSPLREQTDFTRVNRPTSSQVRTGILSVSILSNQRSAAK